MPDIGMMDNCPLNRSDDLKTFLSTSVPFIGTTREYNFVQVAAGVLCKWYMTSCVNSAATQRIFLILIVGGVDKTYQVFSIMTSESVDFGLVGLVAWRVEISSGIFVIPVMITRTSVVYGQT